MNKTFISKKILFSISIGFLVSIVSSFNSYKDYYNTLEGISDSIIRLHIIANSNTDYDQNLKLFIRDAILDEYGSDLKKLTSKEDALNNLHSKINDIEIFTNNILQEKNIPYTSTVVIENINIPEKNYGLITLPESEYTALNIRLGKSSGENWWCIMFPPVCFVDASIDQQYLAELESVLSDDELDLVLNNVNYKFKLLELLKK